MRRLIALVVIALVGATTYGLTSNNAAVTVSGARVANSTFSNELLAISTTPVVQCYMQALGSQSFGPGAGSATVENASAAQWASIRIEGLAIAQFVKKYLKYTPNAAALVQATSSLEGEMTSAASKASLTCPGTSAQALAAMPSAMRATEVEDQAYSTYYVSRLDGTIPVTVTSLEAYFSSHLHQYDTVCVSIALVSPTNLTAFDAAQAKGESVAQLAAKYSSDPSASKGGAYGCYPPSNGSYASVRADVAMTPLNTFPKAYQVINYNGGQYALFVAPTSRTASTFTQAATAVYNDVQALNATNAKTHEENILYEAAVRINPAFGRWGLGSSGPSVFANSLPAIVDVNGAKVLSTPTSVTYK